MTDVKNSKLEIEYEVRFITEREENLKKKLDMKEQEIIALRKKEDFEADIL